MVNVLLQQPALNLIFFYWVGYNWIWIIRSVKTDLGRWKLVEVVINIDAYPFLIFTDLTCHLDGTGIVWTPPHQVFTNHNTTDKVTVFSLFKFFIIITNIFHWFASLSSHHIKLLVLQKYDLQITITCCHSIIIKEYSEGICLKRHKCIHLVHPFESLLL